MKQILSVVSLFTIMMASWAMAGPNDPVVLGDLGAEVKLSNGKISFIVGKADATIRTMKLGSSANLAGRGAYFAVANSVGRDGWDVHNAVFKIERNTADLVELSFGARIGGVYFTQYYILKRGDQGFYVSVLMQRRPGPPREVIGQIRWSFYLNNKFDYQLVNDKEQGPIPDMRRAVSVQDATYRLPDGSVYTKYNYCDYLENNWVYGLCQSGAGGYGAFIITPSTEFLQAPTKQEITVHAGPIMHRFLASGHFEPRNLSSPTIPEGWSKFCGPWMVYLNSGDSPQQMWADVKTQAEKEKAQWPYAWMQHPDYPLERGEVSGTLKLYDGNQPAANALMVLTAPQPDWQIQVLNYIFNVRADAGGHFTLPHVRPGSYTLFAAVPGVTDEFRKDNITVTANGKVDLGTLVFTPAYYSVKLWEIGMADLRTTGFKLSDQPRQYGLDKTVPSDLTYTIGTSIPSRDWYYSQAKQGDWKVNFNVNRTYGGEGVLTIGVAGQTSNPRLQVLVNNNLVGTYTGGNSSAEYRSAILGSSYHENKIIRFPASLLRSGVNTVTLRLGGGSIMYDVVKLEIDDPKISKQIPRVMAGLDQKK
ncbi:MAG: polysaccharide lyase family protein [Verrucomicrobiota bacterium]|jgi:rhamnogalacturonan endolyase